ncbi:MAG: MaoC family dehydratase N-terminal domain-containing protein [Pseudomonadota bacterium]
MEVDIDHLRSWIGRTQEKSEILTPTLVEKFSATFDQKFSVLVGEPAPLLIHLCLAQPTAPMSDLGRDGHPKHGDFLPPVPLPRRMWAGGAFDFIEPMHIGDTVSRLSTIANVQLKQGRSGPLFFVTVNHEMKSDDRLVLTERQDIVYRDIPASVADRQIQHDHSAKQSVRGTHSRTIKPHPTLLFRYSALTFNGHRIHYDRSFCMETEGYPGLVVHGPMQATMLCQFAADLKGKSPRAFNFRSISPIFDNADFTLNADEAGDTSLKLWTAAIGGPIAMEAQAQW